MRELSGVVDLSSGRVWDCAGAAPRRCRVLSQSPLRVDARVNGESCFQLEAGLIELRKRFPKRRVIARAELQANSSESHASVLNALSFCDVVVLQASRCSRVQAIASSLRALGCQVVEVSRSEEAHEAQEALVQLRDIVVQLQEGTDSN